MDFTFSGSTTASMTPNGDLNKLLTDPANRRAYYGHIEDIVSTTFNTTYMAPWANHYSCFLPSENLAGFLGFIDARSAYALRSVDAAVPPVAFAVTGGDTETSGSSVTATH